MFKKKMVPPNLVIEVTETGARVVIVVSGESRPYIPAPPSFSELPTGEFAKRMFFRDVGNAKPHELATVVQEWVANCAARTYIPSLQIGTKVQIWEAKIVVLEPPQ